MFSRQFGRTQTGRRHAVERLVSDTRRAVQRQRLDPTYSARHGVAVPVDAPELRRRGPRQQQDYFEQREATAGTDVFISDQDQRYATARGVGAQQAAFDELAQRAVLLYVAPDVDAVRPSELMAALKRVDPDFTVAKYGAPEFQLLLRNCKYLKSWGGKLAFERLWDKESDECVGLDAYEFSQAPSRDRVRAPPSAVKPWRFVRT